MLIYILLFFGIVNNIIAANKVKQIAEYTLECPYKALPDIIHLFFPKIPTKFPDYFLLCCMFLLFKNYYYLENVEKNILCLGLCTIIRSITVFFTIMPTCMPKPDLNDKSLYNKWFLSTHDLMFSGHSLFFIAIGNILNLHIINIIGPFSLVLARQHYTIDVCVSGLVYYAVYTNL